MIQRPLDTAAAMVHGRLVNGNGASIAGVEIDSRKLQPGQLFVPLAGARVDGHDFWKQAESAGAAAMLWNADHPLPETSMPLIVVEDTEEALRQLARAYLEQLDCKVIAITGSNGKTSVKDMFADVFARKWKTHKTPGNRNNQIGLPLTILEMDADTKVAVLEMGMENFHEIEQLTQIAPPDIAVITSIGSAHMENLGSKEGIARAKLEILDGLKEGGLFLYNCQSPEIETVLASKNSTKAHKTVAFGKGGDVYLTGTASLDQTGQSFQTSMTSIRLHIPSFGSFMPTNALPVIYAALHCGIPEEEIAKGLDESQLTGMRLHIIPVQQARILDDTYKSNPESAMAAIDTLVSLPAHKHAAVLSDMLDLGPESASLHAAVGEYAKKAGVDVLFATGPMSQDTAAAFGQNAFYFENKADLVREVKKLLKEDAVILVKGSRAMAMDSIVKDLQKEN